MGRALVLNALKTLGCYEAQAVWSELKARHDLHILEGGERKKGGWFTVESKLKQKKKLV